MSGGDSDSITPIRRRSPTGATALEHKSEGDGVHHGEEEAPLIPKIQVVPASERRTSLCDCCGLFASEEEKDPTISTLTGKQHDQLVRGMRWALILNIIATSVSFAGYLLSSSTALLADAAHMTIDCISYALNFYAEYTREEGKPTSTGFWAPVISSAIFILISGYIVYEAVDNLMNSGTVHAQNMAIFSGIGLLFDVITVVLMWRGVEAVAHGHSHAIDVGKCSHGKTDDQSHSHGVCLTDDHGGGASTGAMTADEQQYLNVLASCIHILSDMVRSIVILSLALLFLATHMDEGTANTLDAVTALVICGFGVVGSLYVLRQAFQHWDEYKMSQESPVSSYGTF